MVDKDHIHDFLTGLSRDLNEVKGRILKIRHFLVIDEEFPEVLHEEYLRK